MLAHQDKIEMSLVSFSYQVKREYNPYTLEIYTRQNFLERLSKQK